MTNNFDIFIIFTTFTLRNNFKLDTAELRKQGEEIKHKLNNLIKSIKQQQEQSQLIHDGKHDPIMYS